MDTRHTRRRVTERGDSAFVDGENPPVAEYELPLILSKEQTMEVNADNPVESEVDAVYFDSYGEAVGGQVLTDIAADLQGVNGGIGLHCVYKSDVVSGGKPVTFATQTPVASGRVLLNETVPLSRPPTSTVVSQVDRGQTGWRSYFGSLVRLVPTWPSTGVGNHDGANASVDGGKLSTREFAQSRSTSSDESGGIPVMSCWISMSSTALGARPGTTRQPPVGKVVNPTLTKQGRQAAVPVVSDVVLVPAVQVSHFNHAHFADPSDPDNYYYYYYRKKRFRWRNVKRLQGHLTNAKDSDKTRVQRKVRTQYLSDAIVGRAVEIRKTSSEQFRLQLTCLKDASEDNDVRDLDRQSSSPCRFNQYTTLFISHASVRFCGCDSHSNQNDGGSSWFCGSKWPTSCQYLSCVLC